MELWRKVWRDGLLNVLPKRGLRRLRAALIRDDPRLVQEATTLPPAADVFSQDAVRSACAIGYCSWQDDGMATVGEVDARFSAACAAVDEMLGEPGICRHFLNWFDQTPRDRMRSLLLAEVDRALGHKGAVAA